MDFNHLNKKNVLLVGGAVCISAAIVMACQYVTAKEEEAKIVEPELEPFDCPICFEKRCSSCISPCGHQICQKCMEDVLNRGVNNKCAYCRAPLPNDRRKYNMQFHKISAETEDIPFGLTHSIIADSEHFYYYLAHCEDVNHKDACGNSSLVFATVHKNLSAVRALVARGGDVSARDGQGRTLLHVACRSGAIQLVRYLASFESIDPNERAENGEVAMHAAIAAPENSLEAVRLLVARGADASAKTNKELTPLAFAAMLGKADVLDFLLQQDAADKPGRAIVEAVKHGHLECLKTFHKHGKLLGIIPFHFPLFYAASRNHPDVLRYYMELGADMTCDEYHLVFGALKGNAMDSFDVLLEAGAPLNPPDPSFAPLVLALHNYDSEVVRKLLEKGADPNVHLDVDQNGFLTPLTFAVVKSDPELARLLLRHGAQVNTLLGTQPQGGTCLLQAVARADEKMARLLCENGAEVNFVDARGFTSIQYAMGPNQNEKLVQTLLEFGAPGSLPIVPEHLRLKRPRIAPQMPPLTFL